MTVNELRHLLFDLDNQNAEVSVLIDGSVSFGITVILPSDVNSSVVYLCIK